MAWDVLSGVTKMAWNAYCLGRHNQHGMFCPGWQILVGCFVRVAKNGKGYYVLWCFFRLLRTNELFDLKCVPIASFL